MIKWLGSMFKAWTVWALLVLISCSYGKETHITKRGSGGSAPFNRMKFIKENCPGVQSLNSVLKNPKPVTVSDMKKTILNVGVKSLVSEISTELVESGSQGADSLTVDWSTKESDQALCILGFLTDLAERLATTGQIPVCSTEFKKKDTKGAAKCLIDALGDVVKQKDKITSFSDHPSGMEVAGVVTLLQMDIHGIARGVGELAKALGSEKGGSAGGPITNEQCKSSASVDQETSGDVTPLDVESLKKAVNGVGLQDWGINLWQRLHDYVNRDDTDGLQSYLNTAWPKMECGIVNLLGFFNKYFAAGEQQICDSQVKQVDVGDVTHCMLDNTQQLTKSITQLLNMSDDGSFANAVVLYAEILVGVSRAEHGVRVLSKAIKLRESKAISAALLEQGWNLL